MTIRDLWFSDMVAVEGRTLDLSPDDPGNWTGGICGVGKLKGSIFGLSAAIYPTLDFGTLTEDQAKTIALRDYWDAHALDSFPAPVAYLLADAFYNGGAPVKWLQYALGVAQDGAFGDISRAALGADVAKDMQGLLRRFCAKHLAYYAGLNRPDDELGWAARGLTVYARAVQLAGGLAGVVV